MAENLLTEGKHAEMDDRYSHIERIEIKGMHERYGQEVARWEQASE